jgi:hypothetical protein
MGVLPEVAQASQPASPSIGSYTRCRPNILEAIAIFALLSNVLGCGVS